MFKRVLLLSCLFLLILLPFSQAMAVDGIQEVDLRDALKQLHLVERFRGEIVTRLYLEDGSTVLTYTTELTKDGGRSDVNTIHTFWQLRGTEIGRLLRAIPWLYLPPNYSLVQYALPISRQTSLNEPLTRVGDDYLITLVEILEDGRAVFELDNGFVLQRIFFDSVKGIITQIQFLNAAGKVMAFINYLNWLEYSIGILLPESIRVYGEEGQLLLELAYVNWIINQELLLEDRVSSTTQMSEEWTNIVQDLKTKIMEDPDNDQYRYQLSKMYQEQRLWSNALDELHKALTLNPRIEYREEKAKILEILGQYQDAINQTLVILQSNPSGSKYFTLGNLYLQVNRIELAQDALEQAIILEGDVVEYWDKLFSLYRGGSTDDERMLRRAIQAGEKLVYLEPQSIDYRIALGDLHLQNRNRHGALIQFQRAQEIDPEDSLPLIKLGQFYEDTRNYEEALAAYRDAARVKEHWWNFLQLGDYHLRQNQLTEALVAYERSLQLHPRNTDLAIQVGRVLWNLNRPNEAIERWNQILKYEANYIFTYLKVAEVLIEFGLVRDGEQVLLRAIDRFRHVGDPDVISGLAQAYEIMGLLYLREDSRYAYLLFEKGYQYQPRSVIAQYLGLRELEAGSLDKAFKYWNEAHLLDGNNYWPYLLLSVVRGLQGQPIEQNLNQYNQLNQNLTVEEWDQMDWFWGWFNFIRLVSTEESYLDVVEEAFQKGMDLFIKGDLRGAVDNIEWALSVEDSRKGHFFLGVILALQNRTEEAEIHFEYIQSRYRGTNLAIISSELNQMINNLFWNFAN